MDLDLDGDGDGDGDGDKEGDAQDKFEPFKGDATLNPLVLKEVCMYVCMTQL